MLEYLLRLALLLPLVGGLAWASLWMWKRLQSGLPGTAPQQRLVRLVQVMPVDAGSKLAVVEFGGKLHLLAIGRGAVIAIATDDRGDFNAD